MISPKNALEIFLVIAVIFGFKFLSEFGWVIKKRRQDRNYTTWQNDVMAHQVKKKAEYDRQRSEMVKH